MSIETLAVVVGTVATLGLLALGIREATRRRNRRRARPLLRSSALHPMAYSVVFDLTNVGTGNAFHVCCRAPQSNGWHDPIKEIGLTEAYRVAVRVTEKIAREDAMVDTEYEGEDGSRWRLMHGAERSETVRLRSHFFELWRAKPEAP